MSEFSGGSNILPLKSVYLQTYGCQMNEYDSGLIFTILEDHHFKRVQDPDKADIILLNTCAVRENAHQKVFGRLQSFASLKHKKPDLLIGILGCMAQNLGEDLFAMGLHVDFIVGPDNYRSLPDLLRNIQNQSISQSEMTSLFTHETYDDINTAVTEGCQALVAIMRGCNNFCSFCVVPYTRGRERSRSPEKIIDEVNRLVEYSNVKEINLLGQNVNSYFFKPDETGFTGLVKQLLDKTDIQRIRFTSPHPHDFPSELLELMRNQKRFCSSIHLPVQSGSNEVLSRMKRDYIREDYLALVEQIRDTVGEVGLTTDVIVGFPGESEEHFQKTMSLMELVRFDMAFMFRYSERVGTIAAKRYKDDVPEDVKIRRLSELIELQLKISSENNSSEVGRVHEVLTTGPSKRSEKELMGRTDTNKVVVFPIPDGAMPVKDFAGKLINVKINRTSSATLLGKVI